ncbi:MAG: hypothetical protein K2X55_01260 [Burkholderiaceae bacterium]|nr:hypothetical protein [Burkholderiaceae bacterium]
MNELVAWATARVHFYFDDATSTKKRNLRWLLSTPADETHINSRGRWSGFRLISLDDAPKCYTHFDVRFAKKFVIDPHQKSKKAAQQLFTSAARGSLGARSSCDCGVPLAKGNKLNRISRPDLANHDLLSIALLQNLENLMKNVDRPTKERVRAWLQERRQGHPMLPDLAQIRNELGWQLECIAYTHDEAQKLAPMPELLQSFPVPQD